MLMVKFEVRIDFFIMLALKKMHIYIDACNGEYVYLG
jgi:hypothetical protein